MSRLLWDPCCQRPIDLVAPVRIDPEGVSGPTRGQAQGPHWQRVSSGLYVPTVRPRCVEQRILEQGARLPLDFARGVVTGWAALRWRGAAFFDGTTAGGTRRLPVEIAERCGRDVRLRPTPGCVLNRRWLWSTDHEVIGGLPVATVQRALFDEIFRRRELWAAVEAIDMAAAAGLISAWLFATYVGNAYARNGVPLARHAVSLAVDETRSPRETWLRLVWRLVAGLDEPLVNQPVYDHHGDKIGTPDLLDLEAGLVVEYDGAQHFEPDARRRDLDREDAFRGHGLEHVSVVRGESRAHVADRMLAARRRARFEAESARTWTIERPAHLPPAETLDQRLERLGRVDKLTRG